jgi:hypothetical protein
LPLSQFRLNNSCLRNVYYIVEQWNIGGYLGNPDSGNTTAQAVATARSQTQVTDGFFVKDTHKLSETIEYLRLLTEVIVETHQVIAFRDDLMPECLAEPWFVSMALPERADSRPSISTYISLEL